MSSNGYSNGSGGRGGYRGGRGGYGGGAKSGGSPSAEQRMIWNCKDVRIHLERVKAEKTAAGVARWWENVLIFFGATGRPGQFQTMWFELNYVDEAGVKGQLMLRVLGEKHIGMIMPTTDDELQRIMAETKSKWPLKKRDKGLTLQFRRWRQEPQTAENGITILKGEDGRQLLPSDEERSDFFAVSALVNEAFRWEASTRVKLGQKFLMHIDDCVTKTPGVPVDAILKSFQAFGANDMIVDTTQADAWRDKFGPDFATLFRGVLMNNNTRVAVRIQERISKEAKNNAGELMANPITRVDIKEDKDKGLLRCQVYDGTKPITGPNGKRSYELAKVDGAPVTSANVHKFIRTRSICNGVIDHGAVCFSNMGLSLPVRFEILIVAPPAQRTLSIDDFFGEDDFGGFEAVTEHNDEAGSVLSGEADAAGAVSNAAMEAMLSDLSVAS